MRKIYTVLAIAIMLTFTACADVQSSSVSDITSVSTEVSSADFVDNTSVDTTVQTVTTTADIMTTEPVEQTTTAVTEPQDTEITSVSTSAVTEATTTIAETTTTVVETTTATAEVTTSVETTPEEVTPEEALTPMMEQYNEKLSKLESTFERVSTEKTMPAVYVTTLDNKIPRSKEEYVTSVIDVFNCDEEYRLTAEAGIRVRGNSTADGSEKPYRIKFDKKQNMLGLHDGMKFKSWVLLRSQWNLVADYMGFSLAEEIFDGKYYSSDCTYVNLYMNGKYLGLYLLCEQNQANENRVAVYEPKKDELGTDIGYFIEIDNYAYEGTDPYFTLDYQGREFTDIEGKTQVFSADDISIKSEIRSDAQKDFIAKYMDGVFTIMYEAVENEKLLMFDKDYNVVSADGVYSSPEEAVNAVIDLDSMVNTMILQELVHNYDVGAGSFFMAVDFSEDSRYERLTFLAPWDFNWGYSEETNGRYYAGAFQKPVHDMWDRSNAWLTVIMKADWFVDRIKDKWAELDNGNALITTISEVQKGAEALENDLGDLSWRIDSAKDVVKFVRGRIRWLNTQWNQE